jgi:hypothetical protein
MRFLVLHCETHRFRFFNVKEERSLRGDYRPVGQVEADDLDAAFCQLQALDENGFHHFIPLQGQARCRSLSVGDILVTEQLEFFSVDSVGFSQLALVGDTLKPLPQEVYA